MTGGARVGEPPGQGVRVMHAASILNDVLGPVMRGPSNSHTAGSCRIGRLMRDLAMAPSARAMPRRGP